MTSSYFASRRKYVQDWTGHTYLDDYGDDIDQASELSLEDLEQQLHLGRAQVLCHENYDAQDTIEGMRSNCFRGLTVFENYSFRIVKKKEKE